MRKLSILFSFLILFAFIGCALKDPGSQHDLAPAPGFRMGDKDQLTALASGDMLLVEDVSDADTTKYTTVDDINTYLGSIYQPLTAYLTDLADGNITSNFVNETYPWAVNEGGTGAATFTDGGILLGSGTGAITALGVASNGQIPIGDGTTDPVLATITATANETTVTSGAGSITLGLASGINATKIADGSVGNTEFQRIDGITDAGQTLISDGNITAQRATLGLADKTNATASGAYYIGAYDEFANSTGNDTQTVLDDLDAALDLRCLESVFGTSIHASLLLDGTVLKTSAILQKYHAIDPSSDVEAMLASANDTAILLIIGDGISGLVDTTPADGDFFPFWDSDDNATIKKGAVIYNEASLYARLSDVSQFYEPGDNITTASGTTLPAICQVGQTFLDTDYDTDGLRCECVSTNVWKCGQSVPADDKILEGNSSWEIIDIGTGRADCDIDGILKARINADGLDVNGTITADGYNIDATASPRVRALDSDCPGTDKHIGSIDWQYVDGGDGAENGDIFLKSLEGGANTTQMQYDESEERWEIASGKGLSATGPIMGGVNISAKSDGNYTVGTDDAFESYGTMFINSDNDVITFYLPSAVKGMWACFENGQGVSAALTIDCAAGDYLVLKGTRTGAGAAVASTGALGDGCCVYAIDGTDWHVKGPIGIWGMP